MSTIEERVLRITDDQLGLSKGEAKLDSKFHEDLGADSLDEVEIIMELEDEFEMEIPDLEAEKLKTPADVIAYVTANV